MVSVAFSADAEARGLPPLFDEFEEIVRTFGRIANALAPDGVALLNAALQRGCVMRLQFDIGKAGPLQLGLMGVNPDGTCVDLLHIDPPAGRGPFSFDPE